MILHRKRRQFFLFIVDIALMFASLYMALWIRSGQIPSPIEWQRHALPFVGIFTLWSLIFYTGGLYILELNFGGLRFMAKLVIAVAIAFLSSAFIFYLARDPDISPKTILALQSGLAALLVYCWRYFFYRISRDLRGKLSVTFIGSGPEVDEISVRLKSNPHLGMEVKAVVPGLSRAPTSDDGDYGLAKSTQMPVSDVYVIKESSILNTETRAYLFGLVGRGPRFVSLPDFYELILRRVPLASINDLWFLDKIDILEKKPYLALKRVLDVFLALILLIALSPILFLTALAVRISSPGPIIYKQVRLGQLAKEFVIWKFRTMRVEGNDGAPTGVGDARITSVGKFMRATRLDELPQIVNILNGDMSFIGPRPERPELAEGLKEAIPFYMERLLVKPGVTGWDQVSGEYHSPSIEDTYKKLQYDLYYIKNLSPLLDASIFFKTIMTVLSRSGR